MGGNSSKETGGLSGIINQIEKNTAKMGAVPTNIMSNISSSPAAAGEGWSGKKIAIIAFSLLFIITAFLTLVHFFVTPIFQVRLGKGGFIPIPGRNDSNIFWEDNTRPITPNLTSIGDTPFNYSIALDVFLNNPAGFLPDNQFRVVMIRKEGLIDNMATKVKNPDTLATQINGIYNLAIYFDKNTNDLIVTVITSNNNQESIIVENAPTRQAFRVGVVVGSNTLDVYMNGRLYKSKALMSNPIEIRNGMFVGPDVDVGDIIQARQLQIWNRSLQPGEFKDIIPPLSTFTPTIISDTQTCSVAPSTGSIKESFESLSL
jgi:hypothetical protein